MYNLRLGSNWGRFELVLVEHRGFALQFKFIEVIIVGVFPLLDWMFQALNVGQEFVPFARRYFDRVHFSYEFIVGILLFLLHKQHFMLFPLLILDLKILFKNLIEKRRVLNLQSFL